ncbi:MAG: efflux transporter outer membrane subunit [Rubrivivax sp.]
MRIRPNRRRRIAASASRACAAGLLLVLAGCTMGPEYKRPEVSLPPVWRAELPNAADVANTEWWQSLGDAQLDALIEAALAANKDLMLATLRIEELDARLQISRSANYPQIGYAVSGQRERRSQERPNGLRPGDSPSLGNYEISSNLTWELDLWGRVKRANEAARAELLASEEGRRAVMLTVVSATATAYVQLLSLDQRLALARQTLANRDSAADLSRRRFEGGSGTAMAVEQALSVAAEMAAEIPPLEREIRSVENNLSALLGRNPGPVARGSIEALQGRQSRLQLPAGVPADVLVRRPDVLAAEQGLVAANARIGVAKAGYFPVISLNAIIGLAADDPRWLGAETARTGNYGAGLAGPLFAGGRIDANVREAEALSKQMTVRFQKAVQQAVVEVEDALITRTKSGEREAALARQLAHLQRATALEKARFTGGRGTQADVLDAERRELVAQSQQGQGQRDSLMALIAVYKAMGGGWMLEREKREAPPPPPPAPDVAARGPAFEDEVGK